MSRRRIPTTVAAASLAFAALLAAVPIPFASPAATAAAEEPLPGSATGKVRVVFADATAAGVAVARDHEDRSHVRIFDKDPGESVRASVRRWKSVPGVVDARPEIRFHASTIDDTYWSEQWDMNATSTASSRAESAWSVTTGSSSVVVAVLDTGRTEHPDLVGPHMPDGWGADMVSSDYYADDPDSGRDTDPTDTGDYCGDTSSWHGTHVAGTIAAQHNNRGVRGIAPGITLMHVRVLAHCGGDDVDIVDGIRWAAGLTTDSYGRSWASSNLTTNPHPADVINLSLGGLGRCSSVDFANYRQAIAEARAAGTVIVVAAGNDNSDARNYMPASCSDVITVAATGETGSRAHYSNYGGVVDIAAPGGDNYVGNEILSTIGVGDTVLTGYGYTYYQGTSMAAPHVAGAVALLRSVWPDSTVADVERELRLSARAFPGSCLSCGAGLLDIAALVSRTPQATLSIDNDPAIVVAIGIATTISTTGGSGTGGVTFATSTSSICSIRGAVVTGRRAGTCIITATKDRSAAYFATTSAPISITVVAPPRFTRNPVATFSLDRLTVSATAGTWSGGGSAAYEWYRCTSTSRASSCTLIGGETNSSYTVRRPSDIGYVLRVKVTITSNGISVSAWSNPTSRIAAL